MEFKLSNKQTNKQMLCERGHKKEAFCGRVYGFDLIWFIRSFSVLFFCNLHSSVSLSFRYVLFCCSRFVSIRFNCHFHSHFHFILFAIQFDSKKKTYSLLLYLFIQYDRLYKRTNGIRSERRSRKRRRRRCFLLFGFVGVPMEGFWFWFYSDSDSNSIYFCFFLGFFFCFLFR